MKPSRTLLLLLGLALMGCQKAMPNPAPRPRPLLRAEVFQEGGHITLTAHLRWPSRGLLNVVQPYQVADVARVEITLHRQNGDVTGPAIATLALDQAGDFSAPLRFSLLSPHTTYVLRGAAFDSENSIISDPTQSEVRLTLEDDDAPPPVALFIHLRDRPFASSASLAGIPVSAGVTLVANRGVVSTLAGPSLNWQSGPSPRVGLKGFCIVGSENTRFFVDTDHHRVGRLNGDGTLEILAGDGTPGDEDGIASAARFHSPTGLALAANGNLFVADRDNHRIRVVTPTGQVTTLAGQASPGLLDGTGSNARFNAPSSLIFQSDGSLLVADRDNHALRTVTMAGIVNTVAGNGTPGLRDGVGAAVNFDAPIQLTAGSEGVAYLLDSGNQSIRVIDGTGQVNTVVTFEPDAQPAGLALSPDGHLWVSDSGAHTLRRIDLNTGNNSVPIGSSRGFSDGKGSAAQLSQPSRLSADADGNILVWDQAGLRVAAGEYLLTLAASGAGDRDAPGGNARFFHPSGLCRTDNGTLWVADTENHRIRRVQPDGRVETLAGNSVGLSDGPGLLAQFNSPWHLAGGPAGNHWVTDRGNHCIREISDAGDVTTFAGGPVAGFTDAAGTNAKFSGPTGLVVGTDGTLYVADTGNHCIRRISPMGVVTTWVGNGSAGDADGTGSSARFNSPMGLAFGSDGALYVADCDNRTIRRVSPEGVVSTFAGSGAGGHDDGPGHTATFEAPCALAIGADGTLFVADGATIRRVATDGEVNTLAGHASRGFFDAAGLEARFNTPRDLLCDPSNGLYVADSGNNCLRVVR